jgi:hypothetical protein
LLLYSDVQVLLLLLVRQAGRVLLLLLPLVVVVLTLLLLLLMAAAVVVQGLVLELLRPRVVVLLLQAQQLPHGRACLVDRVCRLDLDPHQQQQQQEQEQQRQEGGWCREQQLVGATLLQAVLEVHQVCLWGRGVPGAGGGGAYICFLSWCVCVEDACMHARAR